MVWETISVNFAALTIYECVFCLVQGYDGNCESVKVKKINKHMSVFLILIPNLHFMGRCDSEHINSAAGESRGAEHSCSCP